MKYRMPFVIYTLTLANLLNYLDRYIISSVAPKIEAEFGLSHGQTGFLMSAFMVGYVIASPWFGLLGDTKSRPKLMGLGIALWSIATGLSGAVSGFVSLVIARLGVGVGEASYATIAPAYIRDCMDDETSTNKAMAIFYTAIPIGAALGYMFGGSIAHHYDWRYAFYIGAIPGFFVAVVIAMTKEKPRRQDSSELSTERLTLKASWKRLWQNKPYRQIVAGYIAQTFGLGGFAAWAPHYSATALNQDLASASFKIGAITCVAGVIGTLLGGKLGNRSQGSQDITREGLTHSSTQGYLKVSAYSSLIATPLAIWTLMTTDPNQFMLGLLLVQIAIFVAIAPINTATLSAVPGTISATAFAVQIFLIHALGDVISPPIVGFLADHIPMNHAMQILSLAIFISGLIWIKPLKNSPVAP
jgi:MFS transporter, Spinster family, sphingosine-1-phosphate transporter